MLLNKCSLIVVPCVAEGEIEKDDVTCCRGCGYFLIGEDLNEQFTQEITIGQIFLKIAKRSKLEDNDAEK